MNNTYPYYARKDKINWFRLGANKGERALVVKFIGPNEGRVVEGVLGYPVGTYKKNWSEHNFKKIDYSE